MKWAKKPVVIDAEQYHAGETHEHLPKMDPAQVDTRCVLSAICTLEHPATETMKSSIAAGVPHIDTLEGFHAVSDGDWIIRGVKGEYYPCKPDIFKMSYEPA